MTADETARRLEASARCGDDDAVRARLLVARLRTGALSLDRVRLAASLEDIDAFVLLDHLGEPLPDALDLGGDLLELERDDTRVRVVVAAARVVLPWYERVEEDRAPQDALAATDAWLRCPCAEHAATARDAAGFAGSVARRLQQRVGASSHPEHTRALFVAQHAAAACREAAQCPAAPALYAHDALLQAIYAVDAFQHAGDSAAPSPEAARAWLRQALAVEVVPWALGDGDPLLEHPPEQAGPA